MKFKVGDKVVFKDAKAHEFSPRWYPPVGTVGEVSEWHGRTYFGENNVMVQWPNGSTSNDDLWSSNVKWLDLVERDGVPHSSMHVAGLTFTAAMPIISGPTIGPEEGMSITPKRILRSGDRTIVFWQDDSKTIVKRAEDEPDNDYAAFTAAFAIKMFGSNSALKRMIEKKLEHQQKKPRKYTLDDAAATADLAADLAKAMENMAEAARNAFFEKGDAE